MLPDSRYTRISVAKLKSMYSTGNVRSRLLALQTMRAQLARRLIVSYFGLATIALNDRHHSCRWQAAIIVGEFIDLFPSKVWKIIVKHSHDRRKDVKQMLATVLLEHLLPHNFQLIFPLLESEIRSGNENLREILCFCWRFGESRSEWKKIERLQNHK